MVATCRANKILHIPYDLTDTTPLNGSCIRPEVEKNCATETLRYSSTNCRKAFGKLNTLCALKLQADPFDADVGRVPRGPVFPVRPAIGPQRNG